MKKLKKLALARETVRVLSNHDLDQVVGGGDAQATTTVAHHSHHAAAAPCRLTGGVHTAPCRYTA